MQKADDDGLKIWSESGRELHGERLSLSYPYPFWDAQVN